MTSIEPFVYEPSKFKDGHIEIEVSNIERHRNGVTGQDFFVVAFTDTDAQLIGHRFVGIVFCNLLKQDQDGYYTRGLIHESIGDEGWTNPQVAILEIGMLNDGKIGNANKWRGDYYLPVLVDAIVNREKQLKKYEDEVYSFSAE